MGIAASGDSELIRVSVVDFFSRKVLLDSLVFPHVMMAHYNTKYSGITRQAMEDARRRRRCLLGRDKAREAVWQLIGPSTIVIGHAGQQDLTCLRWIHTVIVDTQMVKARRERERNADEAAKAESSVKDSIREQIGGGDDSAGANDQTNEDDSSSKREGGLSLKALASQRLNREIQIQGRGHDSVEDALATRDLLCWQLQLPMSQTAPPDDTRLIDLSIPSEQMA